MSNKQQIPIKIAENLSIFNKEDKLIDKPSLLNLSILQIREWLEELACEDLRGQIHHKPRWAE